MRLFVLLAFLPLLCRANYNDPYVIEIEGEEEIEETEEDIEDADIVSDWWDKEHGPIIEALDNRDLGVVSEPIHQGTTCGSCAYVAGVHALEARVALVSENWVPYSIQDFMNCDDNICGGGQPYKMANIVRNHQFIVSKDEMPYVMRKCMWYGETKSKDTCHCGREMTNYTNVLDDQFVFVGPTVRAETEEKLKIALATGPATTCFSFAKVKGERCKRGCQHINLIVGYTEDKIILQESYGKSWGGHDDGSWRSNYDGLCGSAVLGKAYFTPVFYDYDRANAYYTETDISLSRVSFLAYDRDFYFTEEDTKNIGLAKNRCAWLGSKCKGVVEAADGELKIVASIQKGRNRRDLVKFFQKTQMVVYLHNEDTGKQISLKMKRGFPKIALKNKGSPFFTSYGRFISYNFPNFEFGGNSMVQLNFDIKNSQKVNPEAQWALEECNLQNKKSGMSLDLKEMEDGNEIQYTIGGSVTDVQSDSQRFNIGISGTWELVSNELDQTLMLNKKTKIRSFAPENGRSRKTKPAVYRWNARQILGRVGKPLDENFEKGAGYFEFSSDPVNEVTPTHCKIVRKNDDSGQKLVVVKGKNVKMAREGDDRWSFEYDDM